METKSQAEMPLLAELLADDLRHSDELAGIIHGEVAPEHRPFLALWLAVERLRQTVQTSASAGSWQSSEVATVTKGREVRIEARPGETMSDYRARIAAGLKLRGQS